MDCSKITNLLYFCFLILFSASWSSVTGQDNINYKTETNLSYLTDLDLDDYQKSQCILDIYYPENTTDFQTVVWFHGGGLSAGKKFIPSTLKGKGIAVIAANYRLYPKVNAPVYIEDAAAAVAWAFNNIEKYGGSKEKIFVSGHSAGGYLASMIGLDKSYLEKHHINSNDIAGLIPYSGHTITHFTIRKERGIEGGIAVVDELAPLFHVRPDAPTLVMITGDRELELLGRYEETAYFVRMMKIAGHNRIHLFELDGFNHGDMAIPAHQLLLKFLQGKLIKSVNKSE